MPNNDRLPDLYQPSILPAITAKASRAHQRAMLEVFQYELDRHVRAQKDQIDTQALGDALRCALNEEMDFLDDGLDRANGSQAKLEILAPKLALYSRKNNARIERRF